MLGIFAFRFDKDRGGIPLFSYVPEEPIDETTILKLSTKTFLSTSLDDDELVGDTWSIIPLPNQSRGLAYLFRTGGERFSTLNAFLVSVPSKCGQTLVIRGEELISSLRNTSREMHETGNIDREGLKQVLDGVRGYCIEIARSQVDLADEFEAWGDEISVIYTPTDSGRRRRLSSSFVGSIMKNLDGNRNVRDICLGMRSVGYEFTVDDVVNTLKQLRGRGYIKGREFSEIVGMMEIFLDELESPETLENQLGRISPADLALRFKFGGNVAGIKSRVPALILSSLDGETTIRDICYKLRDHGYNVSIPSLVDMLRKLSSSRGMGLTFVS